jgi:hypothetical protein
MQDPAWYPDPPKVDAGAIGLPSIPGLNLGTILPIAEQVIALLKNVAK